MKIGILGCGKLGLPVAIATASKGHSVLGYDINPKINSQSHPKDLLVTQEADEYSKHKLQDTDMVRNSTLKFADNMEEVVKHSEIIFVAIQTPHQIKFEGNIPIPEERSDFNSKPYMFAFLK